ncbi:hypothetical protein [Streptomyces sp. S.PB5]|uniref:hypothetical protein n=1 Tax=Streptomyces sp. S.PB5 TaxID=3020844 RepID=UPI0025AFABD7|nr:hypothetical protein [Streptomyces sp. S.PB5]MDN3027222.1 hypothetical protein [Streptomyces sp. S.PB5]
MAKVSGFFALGAVGFLGNFATGTAWLNPGIFVAFALLCPLIAIPTVHIALPHSRLRSSGRYPHRGHRFDDEGRGPALANILTGWLTLIVCLPAVLVFVGLIAGLAVLVDSV